MHRLVEHAGLEAGIAEHRSGNAQRLGFIPQVEGGPPPTIAVACADEASSAEAHDKDAVGVDVPACSMLLDLLHGFSKLAKGLRKGTAFRIAAQRGIFEYEGLETLRHEGLSHTLSLVGREVDPASAG